MRRGLAWRIGALMAILAAGLILAGVAAVWTRTRQQAGPALERSVRRALDLVDEAVADRLDRLDLIARLLANDPPFRAYVAEGDRASIVDNLTDRLALYGCDAFVIADARGVTLADTHRRDAAAAMADEAVPAPLSRVLEGEPARGVWADAAGNVFLGAAVPFPAGEAAALLAVQAVDADLASALSRMAGAELAFLSGPVESPRQGAGTLAVPRPELTRLLAGFGPDAEPRRVTLEGEDFVAAAMSLPGEDGEAPARFVALRSVDRELASFRKIESTLVLVGIAALPVALGLGVIVARRITRPIAVLAHATERVRAGDYAAPLPPETNDEVGALTAAFRMMVAQLKEKEDLDAWIGALAARTAGPEAPGPSPVTWSEGASLATTLSPPSSAGPVEMRPGAVLLGRFRVVEPLGAGGMGAVWKARDEKLREFVAIKVLSPELVAAQPDLAERFRQEIRLARRVTHRNVLRTHELLELGGTLAILMECVDGVPLKALLEAGRLPLAAAMRIARQICAGLDAAHEQGVVHRDLKPANVLVDSAGGVKIADFGLARAADSGEGATRAGSVLGTPHYMSPEQASGGTADRRSDVYSAGVLFYEMFCGMRPFTADTTVALLRAHLDTPPPAPRSINPGMSASLEAVLLRALAKDPQARFASARELSEALAAAAAEGLAA
ncbi:MAG: protein kinase domain-containing protein [Candidatus Polarisedimenticolia bacterium]